MIKKYMLLIPVLSLLLTASCDSRKEISYDILESRVREILDLPTFEHVYRDIIYIGEETLLFKKIKVAEKEVLFSIDIVVQAGIDFKDGVLLTPGNGDEITVTLPPAKILMIDADEPSIQQYFLKENRRNPISRLEYYDEIDRSKETIRRDALDRGILYRAEENARRLLKNFLQLTGFETVNFTRTVRTSPEPEAEPGPETES